MSCQGETSAAAWQLTFLEAVLAPSDLQRGEESYDLQLTLLEAVFGTK